MDQLHLPPDLALAADWFATDPDVGVSGFVVMDLVQDARNFDEVQKGLALVDGLEIVWPSEAECQTALEQFSKLHLSHGLALLDALIAATALGHGSTLNTFDLRHTSTQLDREPAIQGGCGLLQGADGHRWIVRVKEPIQSGTARLHAARHRHLRETASLHLHGDLMSDDPLGRRWSCSWPAGAIKEMYYYWYTGARWVLGANGSPLSGADAGAV